jgi:hypothetical protein
MLLNRDDKRASFGKVARFVAEFWHGRRARVALILLAAGALTAGTAASAGEAQHGEVAITCTNPASGATWEIKIDYDRATVDSYPARITAATISWHDAKDGGNYTLDRKSGDLTVVIASSTGGYFLHDRCKMEN